MHHRSVIPFGHLTPLICYLIIGFLLCPVLFNWTLLPSQKKTLKWKKKSLLSSSMHSVVSFGLPCLDNGNQLDSWNCIVRFSRCGGNDSKRKMNAKNTANIISLTRRCCTCFPPCLERSWGNYYPTLQPPLTLIVVHDGAFLLCTTHTCTDFRFIVCSCLFMTVSNRTKLKYFNKILVAESIKLRKASQIWPKANGNGLWRLNHL